MFVWDWMKNLTFILRTTTMNTSRYKTKEEKSHTHSCWVILISWFRVSCYPTCMHPCLFFLVSLLFVCLGVNWAMMLRNMTCNGENVHTEGIENNNE